MRWLLLKDLQILRRSPLLVALLVLYPIVIAVLIGFAISRGPEKPRVAFLNEVPPAASVLELNGQKIDVVAVRQADLQPHRPGVRDEREGGDRQGQVRRRARRADHPRRTSRRSSQPGSGRRSSASSTTPRTRSRRASSQDTIKAEVQDANTALTKQFTKIALKLPRPDRRKGGQISIFGQQLRRARPREGSGDRAGRAGRAARQRRRCAASSGQVANFARLARDNLDLSDGVLAAVGTPIKRRPDDRQRRHHAARRVRRRDRGHRLADVRHAAAGVRHPRARAGGERVPAAGARARVAHRAARGEGRALRRCARSSCRS